MATIFLELIFIDLSIFFLVLNLILLIGSNEFSISPAPSRFLWAPSLSTPEIMMKRVDDTFKRSGNYQWYRGPYNVERRIVLGFIILFFVISLSVLGKVRTEE